jgi:hypothetical protein
MAINYHYFSKSWEGRERNLEKMDKQTLKGYMEFFSSLPSYTMKAELKDLEQAARDTAIRTFGWPIGLVLSNSEDRPKPYKHDGTEGIRMVFEKEVFENEGKRFDYWTLDKNGDYYILSSLFEDHRAKQRIFFDTRAVRTAETFLRTANLYKALNVPITELMECHLEYGGLKGRILSAASPTRVMFGGNSCSTNEIQRTYKKRIEEFLKPEILKEIVFDTVKAITEMCDDMWIPSKAEVIDPIVDNFLKGKMT